MPSPVISWMVAGVVLCVMELILPTAFIELTMGISALIVALVALVLPQVSIQVALWLLLSVILTVLMRRLVPIRKSRLIEDSKEARTLTEILPGETGRVIYEGNSWQAQCDDPMLAIAPNQKVIVVERRGTTLMVLPEHFIRD